MMRNIVRCLLAVMLLGLASCSGDSNTPSGAVKTYLKAMEKGDFRTAFELNSMSAMLSEKDMDEFVEKAEKEFERQKEEGNFEVPDWEIVSEEIDEDGTKAKVTIKEIDKDGKEKEETLKLVKNDEGKWKIAPGW